MQIPAERYIITLLFYMISLSKGSLIERSCSHFPTMAEEGRRVILFCCPNNSTSWFSVKWFKEDPVWQQLSQQDRTGSALVYNEGSKIYVDKDTSILGRMVISNITKEGEGWYRCEVTGPAPVYHTVSIRTKLSVVKLPKNPPVMQKVGNTVSCTVDVPSNTPLRLMWFLDGYRPPDSWVSTDHKTSLVTIKDMSYKVVRCVASVENLYWEASDIIV